MSEKKLVKVVIGTRGTRRVTVPKIFVERLQLSDYVLFKLVGNHLELYPVDVRVREEDKPLE